MYLAETGELVEHKRTCTEEYIEERKRLLKGKCLSPGSRTNAVVDKMRKVGR